ncbi:MAG: heparinase II/III family protein, partial [Deltaproteobacteria bacterium]|nr:heparinase II/III family protein [Deltaproteobacteria bacterium]
MLLAHSSRLLRTLRFLKMRQVIGQLRWRLRRGKCTGPVWKKAPPALAITQPKADFPGAPVHAVADGWQKFRLLNREFTFSEGIDWEFSGYGPLWSFHLHQFDWARRSALSAPARSRAIFDWIDGHRAGVGWNPHSTSLRSMTWIKLLLTSGALDLSEEKESIIRASLAAQCTHLAANLETHILANHYFSNLLALVFAGLAFEGDASRAWLRHETALREELREQVLSDGTHCERSPMYHSLLLESVLDVLNLATARPDCISKELESDLRDAAARMLGALEVLTHPDGDIALFSDSAFGIAQPKSVLESYAEALGVQASGPAATGVLEAGGYVRLSQGAYSVIASLAGPMPEYQPGHAHGDALSFECSVGSARVITDTGVCEYIPGSLRDMSRATQSHATCVIDDQEQAEFWASHRVGGRPGVKLVSVEPGKRWEGTCAGWSTPEILHRRVVEVSESSISITDDIQGQARSLYFVFPLAPGISAELRERRAWLDLPEGGQVTIDLARGVAWSLERRPYFPEFGKVVERWALVGRTDPLSIPIVTKLRYR